MANKKPRKPAGGKNDNKVLRINFSWIYIIIIGFIIWMIFNRGAANPQKIEWAEVQTMFQSGDIKEIRFVRNDFKGTITIRPECLDKYKDKFGGEVPARSPHFIFLVSTAFDAEDEFTSLNASLSEERNSQKQCENCNK